MTVDPLHILVGVPLAILVFAFLGKVVLWIGGGCR